MAESSYATRVFPRREPQAPSEQALDPETLDRIVADLKGQSQAGNARALREITPEAAHEAKWNFLSYRTPEEESMMMDAPGSGLSGVGLAGAGAGGAAVGAIGRGGAKLPPKDILRLGHRRDIIPRYPDFDEKTVKRYFEKGAKGPEGERNLNWYTEGQRAGEWIAGEEEPLLRQFGSVFSQRKGPIPETDLAMKAFRVYKEQGVDGLLVMTGPSIHQRGELVEAALRFQSNPKSNLTGTFTPGSMKRRSYYGARGGVDESVIDTHAGNVASRGRFKPDDPLDYYGIQHGYHDLADKAGVQRRGFQAAVWVPWREEQAALRGVPAGDPSPAARILLQRAEQNPHWQALVRAGKVPPLPKGWREALRYGVAGGVGLGAAAGADASEASIADEVFGGGGR